MAIKHAVFHAVEDESDCTSLASATIPDSIAEIPERTFSGCTSLTNVIIPNSVTNIGAGAFSDCSSLTSVTIPDSVTGIGGEAFSGCTSLIAITVDALNNAYSTVDGVLFDKDQTTVIQCPAGKAGSYTIANSVTSIGFGAFLWCSSLTAITVDALNSVYSSVDGVLFNKSLTTLIQCPGRKTGGYTIPNSVTSIGEAAFSGSLGSAQKGQRLLFTRGRLRFAAQMPSQFSVQINASAHC